MLKFFVFVAVLAVATAAIIREKQAVAEEKQIVPILSQGEEKNTDGSFAYFYEGADGGKREEVGFLKNPGTEEEALVVRGSYRYFDVNGDEVLVEYIADENGFQPHGTIIPKEISQAAVNAAVKSTLERRLATKQNS